MKLQGKTSFRHATRRQLGIEYHDSVFRANWTVIEPMCPRTGPQLGQMPHALAARSRRIPRTWGRTEDLYGHETEYLCHDAHDASWPDVGRCVHRLGV